MVEINNENSLLQLKVASLPDYYRADVLKKWNQWLKARHGSTEKLAAAWGGREELEPTSCRRGSPPKAANTSP